MAILIINNYKNQEKHRDGIQQIKDALKRIGKSDTYEWPFFRIGKKKLPHNLEAIILSGSEAHLQDEADLDLYNAEIELVRKTDLPVLGICFGHQLIGKAFDSKIQSFQKFIKNFPKIRILEPDAIFSSWKAGQEIQVAQHHKDYMSNLPSEFVCLAESETHNIEAMKHKSKPIYGVQAHIERATDEHPAGSLILKNFMLKVVEKIKAEEFKKKVEESEEKYGISDCIYNKCIEEINRVELSQLEEKYEIRIFRPFLITWGTMGRVLGFQGVKSICKEVKLLNHKIEPLR